MLQHRPSMKDGLSFQKRTQNRLLKRPSKSNRQTADAIIEKSPVPRSANWVFSGKTSFYSYSKGKTASGATFDRDAMIAAHRSLPFGTRVRVTDLATTKSVVVRIVDRGPWVRDRVLDLSLGAARTLGITDRGVAQVRVEVL